MFELDARLEADSLPLAETESVLIRYLNDARYPWVLLVPKVSGAVEWFDLDSEAQLELFELASRVGLHLKAVTHAEKINIGALGNVVHQLHVHVVARRSTDAAWPGPVWGYGKAEPWAQEPDWVPLLRQRLSHRCA